MLQTFRTETPADPAALLLLQFLAWVEDRPRLYAETMEAWRTSCPRLPVWEDATTERLVRLEQDPESGGTQVVLTEAGRIHLSCARSEHGTQPWGSAAAGRPGNGAPLASGEQRGLVEG